MKIAKVLVAALFALTSFPFWAQQSPSDNQPNSPGTQQNSPAAEQNSPATQPTTPPDAQPEQPSSPTARPGTSAAPEASAVPETPAIDLRPVSGELVSKLDSKTAKTGDNVVVQTKASVKTADGTEIPKGSKLVGHVIAAQASGEGQNAQVALQFDHAELAGGQSLPIHSQIQSIGSADSAAPSSGSEGMDRGAMSGSSVGAGGSASPSASGAGSTAGSASGVPQGTGNSAASGAAGSGSQAAGTVVARTGQIAIRTTSVPGVLLANNEPGQQDPRMAQASSILLGAKQDIQLNGGTQIVVGIAPAGTAGTVGTK